LPIATPLGGLSELSALADVRYRTGPEQINHRERERAISIMVTPPPQVALEEAINRIEEQIIAPLAAEGQIDDGQYAINLSGAADKLRQAWDSMKWNLLLALIITYLVMAALFESWLYPFVIILSVPLGAVGGFMGLHVLNIVGGPFGITQSLDVLTMLGFIILIGTVVNNPILIVEQALNHIREDEMPHRQAVVESVRTRIRPIFMTTLIGFFGLLPLVISPGAGAELYRGLGSVLLGGLLVSTVFTLFLVPSLFSLALEMRDAIAERVSFWRPTERHEHTAPALANGERLPELHSPSVEAPSPS
jgi:HAE1 family hydrophobic/amphiphilic exporter-1